MTCQDKQKRYKQWSGNKTKKEQYLEGCSEQHTGTTKMTRPERWQRFQESMSLPWLTPFWRKSRLLRCYASDWLLSVFSGNKTSWQWHWQGWNFSQFAVGYQARKDFNCYITRIPCACMQILTFLNGICECFSNPLRFLNIIIAIPYFFAVKNKGFRLVQHAVHLLFTDELHSENQLAFQQSDS